LLSIGMVNVHINKSLSQPLCRPTRVASVRVEKCSQFSAPVSIESVALYFVSSQTNGRLSKYDSINISMDVPSLA
jgi:hypothetical protein